MTHKTTQKVIVNNKKASYDYFLEGKIEAGIVLLGTEVKALRQGEVSINEAYIKNIGKELFLCNSHIGHFEEANRFNHPFKRERKLLCHSKQINKIIGKVRLQGYTIVPLSIYFNNRNIAKIEIAIGKGKKNHDKRHDIMKKEWNRNKERIIKNKEKI